jgi:hypothetical protein
MPEELQLPPLDLSAVEGRIIMVLSTDYGHECDWNVTVDDLSSFSLVNAVGSSDEQVRFGGTWELSFTVEQSQTKVFEINSDFNLAAATIDGYEIPESIVHLDTIELTPLTLRITGTSQNEGKGLFYQGISFVMKDGSEIPAGVKYGGSGFPEIDITVMLQQIIDPAEVSGLKIFGTTIDLK